MNSGNVADEHLNRLKSRTGSTFTRTSRSRGVQSRRFMFGEHNRRFNSTGVGDLFSNAMN
jgi:hypothetical protein